MVCYGKNDFGEVLEIQRFRNGKKSGTWIYNDKNNKILKKERYRKGSLQGTFYYRDGEIIKHVNKKGKVKKFKGCGC
ncbi:MAG: antitoxin component YwqK of YwqJK toxin-antitoxin module [Bacteroidia bacterium]|jgi:antitoxin component YwqK of YwqJK toxin-antitoxin module